jgi:predicted O-methyltransferase YrrM
VAVNIIPYHPKFYVGLPKLANVGTAWNGVDRILYDIVNRFHIPQKKCLEFGVQFGYSTSALANVFEEVTGVDTFCGDVHAGFVNDHFKETRDRLKEWPNIQLAQVRYQEWIKFDEGHYDLIHVDIVHTYEDTYKCGHWSLGRAPVVIFHDTIAFPDVMAAVTDLAGDMERKFYNYAECHGLGILVKE